MTGRACERFIRAPGQLSRVSEFAFELQLCAHLERSYPLVSRQLGAGVHSPGGRVIDVLCVTRGPDFEARTRLTPDAIPAGVVEADIGVGEWTRVGTAFDGPPERAHRLAEAGAEAGFLERARRGGQTVVRQAARYPGDWFGRLVGVENKPDLGAPGALESQLRTDVSLGVLDEVWLATESYVTRAHLNRIPDEVGVWRVNFDGDEPGSETDPESDAGPVEVVREATPLDSDGPGIELLASHPGHVDVAVATGDEIRRQRRRMAERAYGKGWRTYAMPSCVNAEAGSRCGASGLPYCAFKDRLVDAAGECGADCLGYEHAPAPDVDHDGERARRSAWNPDPERVARTQAGLDRF